MIEFEKEYYKQPYYFYLKNRGDKFSVYFSVSETLVESRQNDEEIQFLNEDFGKVADFIKNLFSKGYKFTKEQIKKFSGVNLISYNKNKGKSYALMVALKKARYNTIVLIDSDLIGLQKQNITDLILPVIQNKADLTISLRKNSLSLYKLVGIDFVSGERVFNKKLLGDLDAIGKLKGFGFESFMNLKIIENKQKIKVVNWSNVISPRKSKKFGFLKGVLGDLFMIRDIIKTIGFVPMIKTLFQMRSLIVK